MEEDIIDQPNEENLLQHQSSATQLSIKINEITMILAEKRTSLAVLRTGVALFALPLSILGLLIATSKYWDLAEQWHLFLPIFVMCNFLIILGVYLIIRSIRRIHHCDLIIKKIKDTSNELTKLMKDKISN